LKKLLESRPQTQGEHFQSFAWYATDCHFC